MGNRDRGFGAFSCRGLFTYEDGWDFETVTKWCHARSEEKLSNFPKRWVAMSTSSSLVGRQRRYFWCVVWTGSGEQFKYIWLLLVDSVLFFSWNAPEWKRGNSYVNDLRIRCRNIFFLFSLHFSARSCLFAHLTGTPIAEDRIQVGKREILSSAPLHLSVGLASFLCWWERRPVWLDKCWFNILMKKEGYPGNTKLKRSDKLSHWFERDHTEKMIGPMSYDWIVNYMESIQ